MSRLAGKTALVTGGAQGQGAAEARAFAREGARVVIADVNSELGLATAAEIGEDVRYTYLDVSDTDSWKQVVAEIDDDYGSLDVLVNNAARYWTRPILEESDDALDAIIGVNLKGAFLGIRAVAPLMIASGGGSIINVSSTAGVAGHAGHAAYGMTKWGIRGLTRVAAAELSPSRIRVNCLVPGAVTGPMLGVNIPDSEQRDPDRWTGLPLRRPGEPEEIAEGAVFLASDESSYITGTDLVLDGGATGTG
ncbi:SDR family NAD(P)-dependent oxidoreductase [Rhodococcus opacus]|uniref:3-alpha-hydroxysteroid dehydrogenase n=1 Tax=Rhodococcus opacus TaxID=37919 RepID=A0A2S8IN23_RHOOP|nr:glucose 1-dehydrogenase [Rhodococcus opacus]PQP16095.1 3-alpha-hydroxysteroid dehydrogenase [Rhodococcus opacus]